MAIDGFGGGDAPLPVCRIGSSDYHFAVSKTSPEPDAAMLRIREENACYNRQLQEKYFGYSGASMYWTDNELNWLSALGGPFQAGGTGKAL